MGVAHALEYVWYPIPGSVKELATNSHELWGIGTDNRAYKCTLPCDGQMNQWTVIQSISIPLKKLSLSETEVWGVTAVGEIYRCSLPCEHRMDWTRVSGILTNLQISNRKVIGTDSQGNVYKANLQSTRYYPNVRWHQLPGGRLKSISFKGQDIWGVDASGQVYRFEPQIRFWMQQPAKMHSIFVSKDYLYGLEFGSKFLMRCRLPCLEADWEKTNQQFKRLAPSPIESSTLYAVAPDGKIFMGIETQSSPRINCHNFQDDG